jgi:hypothetical protein
MLCEELKRFLLTYERRFRIGAEIEQGIGDDREVLWEGVAGQCV